MSEEKSNLKIEDVISERLTGDMQKNALDFAAFLSANEISLIHNSDDGKGWVIGGALGNSIGYMMIIGSGEQFPGPWTFWFNDCDFNNDSVEDKLKETAWAHASKCGKCHKGWENCGGGDRIIFGKEFERLCHSPLMFTNPDANVLENAKKLILMLANK